MKMRETFPHEHFQRYFIVKVSFRKGNPVHKAIAVGENDGSYTLFSGGYEDTILVRPELLERREGSFEIVREITGMQ